MELTFSIEEIQEVAVKIIAQNPEKVILFHGEMGAGKTTLIKALAAALGVTGATSSPTFSLVNEYKTTNNAYVFHFDLYRLKSDNEALDFGIDDYLYSGNWCFIEWPDQISNLLPDDYSEVFISIVSDGKRKVVLQ
jgi:tRNA threonylcarbamoyladenosine biosynthesis protein TsaE